MNGKILAFDTDAKMAQFVLLMQLVMLEGGWKTMIQKQIASFLVFTFAGSKIEYLTNRK